MAVCPTPARYQMAGVEKRRWLLDLRETRKQANVLCNVFLAPSLIICISISFLGLIHYRFPLCDAQGTFCMILSVAVLGVRCCHLYLHSFLSSVSFGDLLMFTSEKKHFHTGVSHQRTTAFTLTDEVSKPLLQLSLSLSFLVSVFVFVFWLGFIKAEQHSLSLRSADTCANCPLKNLGRNCSHDMHLSFFH